MDRQWDLNTEYWIPVLTGISVDSEVYLRYLDTWIPSEYSEASCMLVSAELSSVSLTENSLFWHRHMRKGRNKQIWMYSSTRVSGRRGGDTNAEDNLKLGIFNSLCTMLKSFLKMHFWGVYVKIVTLFFLISVFLINVTMSGVPC